MCKEQKHQNGCEGKAWCTNTCIHFEGENIHCHGCYHYDRPLNKEKPCQFETTIKSNHYETTANIDPLDLILAFDLSFSAGNIVKYTCRAGRKDGEGVDKESIKIVDYALILAVSNGVTLEKLEERLTNLKKRLEK